MHSTYIYQGLDVVVFSVLKQAWTKAHDEFEKHKCCIDKTNFLEVYSRAHIKALTGDNILTAFQATGTFPLNHNFITAEVMEPSLETLLHQTILGKQTSNVKVLTKILHNYIYNITHQTPKVSPEVASQTPSQSESIIETLQSTQGAYLV